MENIGLEIGKILRELCPDNIYVSRNTTENECIELYGIFKRKE